MVDAITGMEIKTSSPQLNPPVWGDCIPTTREHNVRMFNIQHLIVIAACAISTGAFGQTASPVQSPARPFNLDIVAPVQLAGSDEASRKFQSEVLPGMLKLANQSLSERATLSNFNSITLDPSKLVLAYDATARVYFLSEGAGFRNSLGISTTGNGPLGKDAALIFPDGSSAGGFGGSNSQVRTSREPLAAGDFVNLGNYKAGTSLDFFLIADGAAGGKNFFSTDLSLNRDGIVHAVSLAPDGSAYLIIGFEDLLGGGDKDYNDLLFAVEIGKANVENLASLNAPEPTLALGAVLVFGLLAGFTRRRSPG